MANWRLLATDSTTGPNPSFGPAVEGYGAVAIRGRCGGRARVASRRATSRRAARRGCSCISADGGRTIRRRAVHGVGGRAVGGEVDDVARAGSDAAMAMALVRDESGGVARRRRAAPYGTTLFASRSSINLCGPLARLHPNACGGSKVILRAMRVPEGSQSARHAGCGTRGRRPWRHGQGRRHPEVLRRCRSEPFFHPNRERLQRSTEPVRRRQNGARW